MTAKVEQTLFFSLKNKITGQNANGSRTCVVRSASCFEMVPSCLYFNKATGAGMSSRGLMLG